MRFNGLDYIILICLAASILIGYHKGLVRSLGGVVSTAAGLIIAFIFRNPAASYLQEHFNIVNDFTSILEKRLLNSTGMADQPVAVTSLPFVNQGIAAVHRQITEFSYLLIAALCFLALYIITSQLLKLSCTLLERTLGHGILGKFNHGGGVLIMLTQNTLIMAVLAGVLLSPLELGSNIGIKSAGLAAGYLESSALLPYLLRIFDIIHALIINGA
ncbi:MAG: CvpA family protein [Syntrophomonadaceae bacterium]|nr:CvpA family protein [Syntrophomonadaceae bacterium]